MQNTYREHITKQTTKNKETLIACSLTSTFVLKWWFQFNILRWFYFKIESPFLGSQSNNIGSTIWSAITWLPNIVLSTATVHHKDQCIKYLTIDSLSNSSTAYVRPSHANHCMLLVNPCSTCRSRVRRLHRVGVDSVELYRLSGCQDESETRFDLPSQFWPTWARIWVESYPTQRVPRRVWDPVRLTLLVSTDSGQN